MVEADESLGGGVNHALERGEPARGVRAEPEPDARGRAMARSPTTNFPLEEAPEAEAEVEEDEVAEDETEAAEDEDERSEAAEAAEAEDADRRRRRRRRRRRGGERPPGDAAVADAPQPTDDGLERVAEIGGDFQQAAPEAGEGGPPNGSRRRRSRRGRRDRFGPRFGETAPARPGRAKASARPEPTPMHGDPALGGAQAAGGMDEAPASIAEALETPLPVDPTAVPRTEPRRKPRISRKRRRAPKPRAEAREPEPAAEEPPRPRRTGWWQRAKSTLVGE